METRWEERRGSRKTVEVGRGGVWTGSSLRLLNVWTGKRTSQMVEKVTERGGEVCAWIQRFLGLEGTLEQVYQNPPEPISQMRQLKPIKVKWLSQVYRTG